MKAISPVIATVIIVAVAISISIAVALWMTGLTSTFTGVEKLEIINAHAAYDSQNKQWSVTITVKNTGTKQATIEHIYVNDNEITDFSIDNNPIDTGQTAKITFTLSGNGYDHGVTVSIIIVSGSGGRYPVTITLP